MSLSDNATVKEQLSIYGLPINVNDKLVRKTYEQWLNKDIFSNGNSDYGTFKESLRAPIHRWFKYPAGYSYRLVEEKIKQYNLNKNHWVFDPFVGSGTTSIECKRNHINSFGIEAHPFVGWIAQKKINWEIDLNLIADYYNQIINLARDIKEDKNIDSVPELVQKCYSEQNLKNLLSIRDSINKIIPDNSIKDFFTLALIDTLRNASKAATGWPYIGPTKYQEKVNEKDAYSEFGNQIRKMYDDLEFMQKHYNNGDVKSEIIIGDSRIYHDKILNESIDLSLTSPPYLNNFDYADRTRLETYFLDWYNSWSDISRNVRDKLIMSATTQIKRSDYSTDFGLSQELSLVSSKTYTELKEKIALLSEKRLEKGGKKSYDILVGGYFTDMYNVIKQVYRTLKSKSDFIMVLGDSAPYGVYIPTHEYLANFALGLGFSKMKIEELRKRGDKWKANPQRHKVKLKEVILTLTK
jgi:DNA modification methylase